MISSGDNPLCKRMRSKVKDKTRERGLDRAPGLVQPIHRQQSTMLDATASSQVMIIALAARPARTLATGTLGAKVARRASAPASRSSPSSIN